MRIMIYKERTSFLSLRNHENHEKEAWYQRGQDFFLFKSWELWEAWFQREDKISFSWNHENHENSNFKEDQNVAFMKSLIWAYDNFSCSHAPGPGYQVFTHFGHKNLHKLAVWSLILKVSFLNELLGLDSTFEIISSLIGWNLFQCISHGMDKSGNSWHPMGLKMCSKVRV